MSSLNPHRLHLPDKCGRPWCTVSCHSTGTVNTPDTFLFVSRWRLACTLCAVASSRISCWCNGDLTWRMSHTAIVRAQRAECHADRGEASWLYAAYRVSGCKVLQSPASSLSPAATKWLVPPVCFSMLKPGLVFNTKQTFGASKSYLWCDVCHVHKVSAHCGCL